MPVKPGQLRRSVYARVTFARQGRKSRLAFKVGLGINMRKGNKRVRVSQGLGAEFGNKRFPRPLGTLRKVMRTSAHGVIQKARPLIAAEFDKAVVKAIHKRGGRRARRV